MPGGHAAGRDRRTGRDRGLELVGHLGPLGGAHHRPDIGVRIKRVAEPQALGVVDERAEVVVVDLARDVEPLRRGADLTGVEVGGPRAAARRDLDLDLAGDIGAYDERVLASELEVDPGDPLGAHRRDPLAGRDRPREGNAVDALIGDKPGADGAVARHDVDDAGRQVLETVERLEGRQRGQLRGLAHGRVAGGQRRGELPREQQERVIPGDDAGDDADRLLHDHRELSGLNRRNQPAGRVATDLGVVVERRGGPADLVAVLDQRLAAFKRHRAGELIRVRPQPRCDLVQHVGPLNRRH